VHESVILYDATRAALGRRSVLQCYRMARRLQQVLASLTGRGGGEGEAGGGPATAPTVHDFGVLVRSAAASARAHGGYAIDTQPSRAFGKLLSAPELLFGATKRRRKQTLFTDMVLLYLQEELPGAALRAADEANVSALSSMYWAHQAEGGSGGSGGRDVWVDKDAGCPTL
jgi:hypothetical protein